MKKLLVSLAVLSLLSFVAVMSVKAEDIVVDNGKVTITNVWFQPFGLVNMTIPWKDAQVTGLVDILHSDNSIILAAEGPVIKQTALNRIIQLNLGIGSVLVGEVKRGLFETSINFAPNTPNLTQTWSGGVWIGSAFDGKGAYGGYKVFAPF